jgi:hypothetical protein
MDLNNFYYILKPLIPRPLQIILRRKIALRKETSSIDSWPIFQKQLFLPRDWAGWPNNKRFALVLTHDVETFRGHERCLNVISIERELGFRSSFNFVPERYNVSPSLRNYITGNGFEVGVHDLNHDGKLFKSKYIFQERAIRINKYLKEWNALGFRSGSMHHDLNWIQDLNIQYDLSTFDCDPFEPYPEGMNTIFPFWVSNSTSSKGFVELPYTMPQDFTLFVLLRHENIDVWKKKLEWIVEKGGMALINTHPDYMNYEAGKLAVDEYPAGLYVELLEYVKSNHEGEYWNPLPKDIARYWYAEVEGKGNSPNIQAG